jgi:hypothetical protein
MVVWQGENMRRLPHSNHFYSGYGHVHFQVIKFTFYIVIHIAVTIARFKLYCVIIGMLYFYKLGLGIIIESSG